MENELILWFWRGLLTLGMGGVVRLLIWQRKIERELAEQKVKIASTAGVGAEVKANTTKVTTLEANMAEVTRVNKEVKEKVMDGNRRLDDVAKTAAQLTGEMKQINNTLHLIQEYLMGQSK